MDDRYFTEEMNYLLEQGREFAKKHPQKARMLHLDDARSRDPHVERLLESFAFLTSRIRKRLDDGFSQLADGLLSLMWPGYINPVPSFSLLKFYPSPTDFQEATTIPQGFLIDSEPLYEGVRCRFRTCFDTQVLPMEISDASVKTSGSSSVLKLSFKLANDVNLRSFLGQRLRIQIVGEFFPCWQIYDLLLGMNGRHPNVEKIALVAFGSDGQEKRNWQFGSKAIEPTGLTKNELVIPTSATTLWSFALLRDFFLFPEKYQAFSLDVLESLIDQSDVDKFDISFFINCPWPSNLRLKPDQFALNTVPIINLFAHDADPIILSHLHHHYTVRGDIQNPEYYQVYSIDSVESIQIGSNLRNTYMPLYTSHSRDEGARENECFYSVERAKASWGGWETFISFVDLSPRPDFSEEEIVSLGLTCTNGKLPHQLLSNQIRFPVSQLDDSIKVNNITHPTRYVLPDLDAISIWRWLSHASLNYLSIQSKEQLKSLIGLHDFSNSEANRHKIEGIKSIELSSIRTLLKGALIPGISIDMVLREENFSHLGEIQLFTRVLSSFLSAYSSINSYVQLSVKTEPSNHRIVLRPTMGDGLLL
jgi:type VI secretion system protein ImpG